MAVNEAIRLSVEDDEVMWSIPCMDKNLEKGSKKKGGPLSEKNCLGVPYCEKRSCHYSVSCQRSWNELST